MLSLVACSASSSWPSAKRTQIPPIPSYPRTVVGEQRRGVLSGTLEPAVESTFQTTDSPATVFTFYQDQLRPRRWELMFPPTDDDLQMNNKEACPLYNLYATTSMTTLQTAVDILVSPSRCGDR